MRVNVGTMTQALKTAMSAVPPRQITTDEEMDQYHTELLTAQSEGIAEGINPLLGTGLSDPGMEMLKLNFLTISWAQFAIFDTFEDESKRATPEPAANPAAVANNILVQGDNTAGKSFTFTSKTYHDMTTIYSGTISVAAPGVYQDDAAAWFDGELKTLTLTDSAGNTFVVQGNNRNSLTVEGGLEVQPGQYRLSTAAPTSLLAFANFADASNGGNGAVMLEVSFDDGANWQTVLDTASGINHLDGTVAIEHPGSAYAARITITNDDQGNTPVVTNFMIATDPSPWRF